MRGNYDNRIDIDLGTDLGNGKYLERFVKFCYLGEIINGNYSISRKDPMCMGKI